MAFCQNCGTKLEHGDAFCPNCGNKVSDQGHGSPSQRVQPAYTASAAGELRATGGLKVWLWILIVCGIIGIIYNFYQIYEMSTLYGFERGRTSVIISILELSASVIISIAELYGEYLMLRARRKGFYIICTCICIGFILTLAVSISLAETVTLTVITSLILSLVSIGILWLFARKQWPNFR